MRANIIKILNNYEQLAISIFNGSVDEEIMKNGFEKLVLTNYAKYKTYIEHLRKDHYEDGACQHFEWLFDRWSPKKAFRLFRGGT